MFTHILMTRFNLATAGRESTLRTEAGWLDRRFALFERYCLPSVAGQRRGDFHWIIYFDIDTPAPYRQRIEELRRVFPFLPFYTALFPAEGWRTSIVESFAPATPLLLTTRLDNDDALALDFTERLHAAVREAGHAPGAYNFRHGLIRRGEALYALAHPCNAFFSWLEPVGPAMRTAPSIRHMRLSEVGPVHQIEGPPAWLQVVHEGNVSNKVRGRRVAPEPFCPLFAADALAGVDDVAMGTALVENGLLAPLRAARDAAWALRQRLRRRA